MIFLSFLIAKLFYQKVLECSKYGQIYFVRHGESKANVVGKFPGQRENSELTAKGWEQARLAAKDLKRKK